MIGLWRRALRSRPLATVVLLVLASVAVATATLGPLLIRAVQQSGLADTVADAAPGDTLARVSVELPAGSGYGESRQQVLIPLQGLDSGRWAMPAVTVASTQNLVWRVPGRGRLTTYSRVVAAEAGCAGIVLVTGRCPLYPGDVLVAAGDAQRTGATAGLSYQIDGKRTAALRVVGTYDPATTLPGQLVRPTGQAPAADSGEGPGVDGAPTGDTLVVTADQLQRLNLPVTVTAAAALRDRVRVDDLSAVRADLGVVRDRAAHAVPGRVLFFASLVEPVLSRSERLSADAAVVIVTAVAQALVVAFFALAIVIHRIGQARAAEWGIGRLRGIPRRRWLTGILVEPGVPLLLGLPTGLALASVAARVAAAAALRPGTPVEPWRWPVLVAGGAAFLGAAVALLVVGTAAVRRPTVELIQQAAERRVLSRLALAGQAGVVLLAAAAVYQLVAGAPSGAGRTASQLALVAPALLALAVAVLAVRAGVLVVRRLVRRPPRSRVGVLVGRPLGRTPSSVNPAVVIAAALALTVFAGQVLALSDRNQERRAAATVGAATVLTVGVPAGGELLTAVQAADPTGRYAMAAVEADPSTSTGTARIVAVDSARYAAVASWAVPGVEQLHAPTSDPVVLRGRSVTVSLTGAQVSRQVATVDGAPVQGIGLEPVRMELLVDTSQGWSVLPLGQVRTGTTSLTAPLDGCTGGCRLVAVQFGANFGTAFTVRATVTGLRTDEQQGSVFAGALRAPGWHPLPARADPTDPVYGDATGTPSAAGLQLTASDEQGLGGVGVRPGDTRDPIPSILAARTPLVFGSDLAGAVLGQGLDAQVAVLRPVEPPTVLPRSLSDGVLVDLRDALANADPARTQGISEVWLAADAPGAVVTALEARGFRVQSRQTLADVRATLVRQAPTRGATIAVTLGHAALGLALVTLLASRLADLGRRRRWWRSLWEAGLSRSILFRLAVVETGLPALVAVLVGVAAGTVAVVLAAPTLPLVDQLADGPPLDLRLAWSPVATTGGVAALLVIVVAVVLAGIETRVPEAGRRG